MSIEALDQMRNEVVKATQLPRSKVYEGPTINMDVEWFPCPHCGEEICAEMDSVVFNDGLLLFFCDEDCEDSYVGGRER